MSLELNESQIRTLLTALKLSNETRRQEYQVLWELGESGGNPLITKEAAYALANRKRELIDSVTWLIEQFALADKVIIEPGKEPLME